MDRYCGRCGNPLPLDNQCDCAGTEIDSTLPAHQTRSPHATICSTHGLTIELWYTGTQDATPEPPISEIYHDVLKGE